MPQLLQSIGSFCLATSCGAALQAEPWHITERTGNVFVLHAGISKTALRGNDVVAGDVIVTRENARAVLVRGEDYLIVTPSSRLTVANPTQATDLVAIIEEAGSAIFKIKHLDKPHFAVKTPYLAVVVKGTTFSVTVSDTGTAVQVIDGAVEVVSNDGGARSIIKSGMIGQISARDLYRLHVNGDKSSEIVSPNAHANGATRFDNNAASGALTPSHSAPSSSSNVITAAITEPVPAMTLSQATGGLIVGNSSFSSIVGSTTTAKISTAVVSMGNTASLPANVAMKSLPVKTAATVAPAPVITAMTPVAVVAAVGATAPAVTPTPVVVAAVPTVAPVPVVIAASPVIATNAPVAASTTVVVPSPVAAPPAVVAAAPTITPLPIVIASEPTVPALPVVLPPSITSCAGVPNCNGATYTGPSNVQNGSSCAGIPNCNGGIFNIFGKENDNNGNGKNNGNGNGNGNNNAKILADLLKLFNAGKH